MSQPYDRVFNFSAGPSTLPVPVLETAREEMLNYRGTGMCVMEMSHRSKPFEEIIGAAERDLRNLLGIPESHKVLFLQGGASLQFSMVPMTFLRGDRSPEYVITGAWGKKALEAAKLEGEPNVLWDGKQGNYSTLPDFGSLTQSADASYVHITSNETIQGVQFHTDPETASPLVCDMSSDICSRPVEVSRYGLIYAGAQKNIGPAGLTIVIIREDMLARVPEKMHPMLDYRLQAENESLYNTPPTWSIYVLGLVAKHLIETGGAQGALERNRRKADTIYKAIEASGGFYKGHAAQCARSLMNVTFTLPSEDLTKGFLKAADAERLDGLKGHRSVGGIRASIYNAFPQEGCDALAELMARFVAKHG